MPEIVRRNSRRLVNSTLATEIVQVTRLTGRSYWKAAGIVSKCRGLSSAHYHLCAAMTFKRIRDRRGWERGPFTIGSIVQLRHVNSFLGNSKKAEEEAWEILSVVFESKRNHTVFLCAVITKITILLNNCLTFLFCLCKQLDLLGIVVFKLKKEHIFFSLL